MAKLSIEQAPAPATPRLFLLTASAWAVAAGALLAVDGAVALASRWGGSTLALVHALTLGLLGNAMFGSLLQFLPVAAGVRVRGGRAGSRVLYGLLNVGTLALVTGFRWPAVLPAWCGGVLLVGAFVLLAAWVLPGMWFASGQRFLRWGIGGAVVGAVVAALLGMWLALGLSGMAAVPLLPVTDVHAAWGTLGWVVALLASVSRVVAPMFQGMAAPPERWHGLWHAVTCVALFAGLGVALHGIAPAWFRVAVGLSGLVFAGSGLLLQARAPRLRKAPLTGFWAAGFVAMAASALVLLGSDSSAVLVGALTIGIGLPLLVAGMQLEIVAFLGWIELHRHCGKGVRLPGVQLLLPERDKYGVLALHLMAATTLVTAALMTTASTARIAGVALMLAHGAMLAALLGVGWRSRKFLSQLPERP